LAAIWAERVRRAAIELSGQGEGDQESVRIALLADIRGAFAARKADRLASDDMVEYLVSLDERPWACLLWVSNQRNAERTSASCADPAIPS
jgi:hypothetical protein